MGMAASGAARVLALGLVVASAACASAPAPVVDATGLRGRDRPMAVAPQLVPYDPDEPPRIADPAANLQCVPFARTLSGIEIYGNANTWWSRAAGRYPRSTRPAPGSVMVIQGYRGPGRGHVAVVREIISERVLRVDHANWLNNGEISTGVPVMDVSEAGDWSAVRVWHIPGNHWGGRVYRVEGFIHPFGLQAYS